MAKHYHENRFIVRLVVQSFSTVKRLPIRRFDITWTRVAYFVLSMNQNIGSTDLRLARQANCPYPSRRGASLPATPTTIFSDGTWFLSVSYFNGVLDSGFLSIGPSGETYIRLDIVSGSTLGVPPAAPLDWRLLGIAGGAMRVSGFYYEDGTNRATDWAIAYTTDGSDPAEDDPDLTVEMPFAGMAIFSIDLPAATDGATMKVRLQTRRNDGTEGDPDWVYSIGSIVKSLIADASGPTIPLAANWWDGPLPSEEI